MGRIGFIALALLLGLAGCDMPAGQDVPPAMHNGGGGMGGGGGGGGY